MLRPVLQVVSVQEAGSLCERQTLFCCHRQITANLSLRFSVEKEETISHYDTKVKCKQLAPFQWESSAEEGSLNKCKGK